MAVPPPNMRPRIVYHKYGMSTGETLKAAFEEGQRTFQQPPKIIFVCLGDTGKPPPNRLIHELLLHCGCRSMGLLMIGSEDTVCLVARSATYFALRVIMHTHTSVHLGV